MRGSRRHIANPKGTVGKDQGGLWLPLHTTRGLDPSQRGSKTQAIIQDRKGMRDWISSLLRISRASPRNTQKGSPPATHCHIDRIHGHNPRRIDAVRNGPHFQRSGGHAVTQRRTLMRVRGCRSARKPVCCRFRSEQMSTGALRFCGPASSRVLFAKNSQK